jgi:hypothetical protein
LSRLATTEELIMRACRDKHGSNKIEATTKYEEWFQSAQKFIVADPAAGNIHKMSQCAVGKAYECGKAGALSRFLNVNDLIPLLLVYKLRRQQTERTTMATTTTTVGGSYWDGVQKSAMDILYYLDGGGGDNDTSTIVRVDQPAIPRRFGNVLCRTSPSVVPTFKSKRRRLIYPII